MSVKIVNKFAYISEKKIELNKLSYSALFKEYVLQKEKIGNPISSLGYLTHGKFRLPKKLRKAVIMNLKILFTNFDIKIDTSQNCCKYQNALLFLIIREI